MSSRRSLLKVLGVPVTVALLSVVPNSSHADNAPSVAGFSPLGQVVIDKSGCPSCPVTFATPKRHRAFALASDSPFAVSQSGRFEVTCANGSTYHVFLHSPTRGGLFQLVPNSCVNLDSKEIKLTITSVSLSPADAERSVSLITYGSFP